MSWKDVSQNASDSINLKEIDGTPFTLVGVEDSAYTEQGKEPTAGVKIETKESWKNANGEQVNKLHTTRRAIVNKLRILDEKGNPTNQKLHDALAEGTTYNLVVPKEKVKAKGKGLPYFDLVEAE